MIAFNNSDVVNRLVQRFGTADWSKWGLNQWSFYDYVRYNPAGVTSIPFFSVNVGGTDSVSGLSKTFEETNATQSRMLGQDLILTSIRTHIWLLPKNRQPSAIQALPSWCYDDSAPTISALVDLSNQGILEIKLGQKLYVQVGQPFLYMPFCKGIDIDQHAASGAQPSIWMQQSTSPVDKWIQEPEQWIESQQILDVAINFTNGTSPSLPSIGEGVNPSVAIGVWLDGYLVRPMQ